ncbi:MAG: hypothetical protein DCC67_19200 [Planctomycetota bacterium]|nr:MAG: hypothetical protein DCC67_19200 [Planctomycetota bacterium]
MGLARLRQLDGEDEDEDLTATGITLGTFDYISPEQARDPRLADARSDIYSLGCTLYYMLAGRAPFAQGTGLQKLLQHQSERPPDLRTYRADVPEPVVRLVRRMLEKDPADRPQSPLELVGELTPIMEALDVPLPYPAAPYGWTVASRPAARWRRHAAWLAPAALLVGFAAIVDGYWRDSSPAAAFPPLREGLPEAAAPPVAGSGADKTAAGALARGAAPTTGRTSTAPAAPAGRPESSPPYRSSSATLEGPLEAGASLWDIVTGAAAPRAGGHQWRLNDGAIGPQISPGGFEAAPLGAPPEVELPFNAGELPSGSAPNSQQP